jgi:type I restriction-modification system DNA methylase subunit
MENSFLLVAAKFIEKSKTYYTPKSVLEKIEFNCVIGNPPYKPKKWKA